MLPLHKKANTGAPLSFGEGKGLPTGQAGVRIIFYSPQTLPSIGGLQYVVHYWAEALSQRGYQVTIITETPELPNDLSKPQRGDSSIRGVQPLDQIFTPPGPASVPHDPTSKPQRGDSSIRGVQPPDFSDYAFSRSLPEGDSSIRGVQPPDFSDYAFSRSLPEGDSSIQGVQPPDQIFTPPDPTSLPPDPSNDLLPPSGGGGSGLPADSKGKGPIILRNIPFFQQVAIMRSADKIIMFNVSLKGIPAWMLSGKPLYISHHTALWYPNGPRPLRQRIKQRLANHWAIANCACSQYIATLYKKCEVIHSPYRADVFVAGSLPRIPGSILFVGRLVSDKGADLLLEACALLKAKGIGFSLSIIGDGPDRQKLEALAEKLKLSKNNPARATGHASKDVDKDLLFPPAGVSNETKRKNQILVGTEVSCISFSGSLPQSELIHHLQTHQVMVIPSRMEPMGMVVAEGLACGCTMVVSNQGGMPEVGGGFCHYFESGNVTALAEALETALTHPLAIERDKLRTHLKRFTIDYSVNQLENWLA